MHNIFFLYSILISTTCCSLRLHAAPYTNGITFEDRAYALQEKTPLLPQPESVSSNRKRTLCGLLALALATYEAHSLYQHFLGDSETPSLRSGV